MNQIIRLDETELPEAVVALPDAGRVRFLEFFTAQIRNPNTRKVYARAAGDFLTWCAGRGVTALPAIQPMHVAARIEELGRHMRCLSSSYAWRPSGTCLIGW